MEIETSTGIIFIATLYQPPTRSYVPIPDFLRIFRRNTPTYMITDVNANHPVLGYRNFNTKGRQINKLIQDKIINHIGPHFPTYIARKTSTTPDIILTNMHTYHNIHIEQGPLTTSDHLPIICTLSIHPILQASLPRPSFKQANWESFTEEIKQKYNDPSIPDNIIIEDIDSYLEEWYSTIQSSIQSNIPYTTHITKTHTRLSH